MRASQQGVPIITIHKWLDNSGAVAFRSKDSCTRAAERVLNAMRPIRIGNHTVRHAHMRIGHYSVVVCDRGVIAARLYPSATIPNDITADSVHWAARRLDRLSQCYTVEAFIMPNHPHYEGIMTDIEVERARLA